MDQLSLILHEIACLGPMRLQALFGLSKTLVFELYSHTQGRVYLLCDYSLTHKSFHVQKTKPSGEKVVTPLILALRKHALHQGIIFMRIEYQPFLLRAHILPSKDYSLIFELGAVFKVGFFHAARLIACATPGQAPVYSDKTTETTGISTLEFNFSEAKRYQSAKEKFLEHSTLRSHQVNLHKELKKKLVLLKNLKADLTKCELNVSKEHDAELIKAHMGSIKRGMSQAMVWDYTVEIPEQKIIPLDPRLSPQQNVLKLFHQVKRARRGLSLIKPRILVLEDEITALKRELKKLDEGIFTPELLSSAKPQAQKSSKKPAKRLPYRIFTSSDNIPLWVGRSAKDNDMLTLHHARGKEWWFHVQDGAGSHVVVKSSEDALPSATMLEAAMLAAHFSSHKNDPNPEVYYTRIRHIRKPKGLAPGKVLIEQEKSIAIKMDQERIAKICS